MILNYYALYISSDEDADKKYKNEGEMFEELRRSNFTTLRDLTHRPDEFETLKKERVKSYQELAIANFYFINGIEYEYERAYEYNVTDANKRPYLPDFYLPKYGIYHEHYGIDKNGNANQFGEEAGKKYVENMKLKRHIHQNNNTICIETYSYEANDDTLFDKLKKELISRGVEFHPLGGQDIYNALESIYHGHNFKSFINVVLGFLSLYKSMYKDEKGFDFINKRIETTFKKHRNKNRAFMFVNIVKVVYKYYMNYLRLRNKIDFDDMILQARDNIENSNNFKYKYVIVDEFQDISLSRARFLKSIIQKGNSKLLCVGDDWQAIYRFSGCDLDIFLNFEKYFGEYKQRFITTTHRNSQELQDIAQSFIMKNQEQISKRLVSKKHLIKPLIITYFSKEKSQAFLTVLEEISKFKERANVLLLGRNRFDFDSIAVENRIYKYKKSKDDPLEVVIVTDYPNMKLSFTTVHSSKGLEEEFVIIINGDNDYLGFPNRIENDIVLNLVLSSESRYPFAEERRLFYVAITRTKTWSYILSDSNMPSIFVKEVEKYCRIIHTDDIEKKEKVICCPDCKSGTLIFYEKYNNYYCSNRPYCRYSIKSSEIVDTKLRCAMCGEFMVRRKGKNGDFYGCRRYPYCKNTLPIIMKKNG